MRILFLSDFHGRVPHAGEWSPDLVVAGGDYCEVDEIRRLKFEALGRKMKAGEWRQLVSPQRAGELVARALAEGSAVVAALAECGAPVLAIPGNSDRVGEDDETLVALYLPRPDRPAVEDRLTNIETRVVRHGGLFFAGLGGWSGAHLPERTASEVGALVAQRQALEAEGGPAALVLVSHNVPWRSQLDGVNNPELPGFAQGHMVGSRRCLAAMAALRPLLCLCGHLHENFGRTETIDGVLCVCGAGAYRGEGVLVDLDERGAVRDLRFVRSRSGAVRVLASS